jgi:hypothetical protein
MKAIVLEHIAPIGDSPWRLMEVPTPQPGAGLDHRFGRVAFLRRSSCVYRFRCR